MCCPGAGGTLQFFNIPSPHHHGPNGPLPSRAVFHSRAGPAFFRFLTVDGPGQVPTDLT